MARSAILTSRAACATTSGPTSSSPEGPTSSGSALRLVAVWGSVMTAAARPGTEIVPGYTGVDLSATAAGSARTTSMASGADAEAQQPTCGPSQ